MLLGTKTLAYGLIDQQAKCTECGSEYEQQELNLSSGESVDFIGTYFCPDCSAEFSISVTDDGDRITVKTKRIDIDLPHDFAQFIQPKKTELYKELHTASELVNSLIHLDRALTLLSVNSDRILKHHETLQETESRHELMQNIEVDLHNFLSSIYSFDQILCNIEEDLPTGGPVEVAESEYDSQKKVLMGLRIYAQHELNLTVNHGIFSNIETDSIAIVVPLEEVEVIESDKEKHPPDGYSSDCDYYEDVDEYIDVVYQVNSFMDSAEKLVEEIRKYTEETKSEELQDYRERTE